MLVLHLQIASIIFEIKIVLTDCSIRVSQSVAAILRHHVIFFFLFLLKICEKLGRSGQNNNFLNRYGLKH